MPTPKKTPTDARKKKAAATPPRPIDPWDFQSDSLGYSLRRAQMRAYDLYFSQLSQLGLSPARMTALSMIATEAGIDQVTLAARLGIAGPSVVKVVDALEGAGLIAREACAGDRRRYVLALTDAGRARLEALRLSLPAYEDEVARGLSAAERAQLLGLLRRIAG